MNRTEFMKELEYLLQDIPDEEKAEALAYYRDYLEDAGDENEKQVMEEFGSPERVAAIIRSDLNGNLEEGGGFTETGYKDERFNSPKFQVIERKDLPEEKEFSNKNQKKNPRQQDFQDRTWFKRLIKVALLLLILGVISPIVLGVGGSILGIVAGIIALIVAGILCIGILTVAACIGAIAILVIGVGMLFSSSGGGILILGTGVFVLGLAFFGVALSVLIYGKFIPFCIRGCVNYVSSLLHRKGGRAA